MSDSGFDMGLEDVSQAGVYGVGDGDLGGLAAAARDAGLKVLRVDLEGCSDKRTLLMRLGTQLDFPPGWSRNWDALSDALRDLSWLPANGYAVLFSEATDLRRNSPEDFNTLLDVLSETAISWAEQNVPFWAFFELPDAGVPADE
ncbi:barstar family protein [Stenotrophomonas sp. MH1]|uniref:Barstar family protein n=1 Tax=Stenotrophomonas capsici TaxID=3110230 RepID=A0ABU5V9Z2_9GAMM|nr:barstar family protein [Stenotrophomonas sp. MH1]MEA5669305.1 barstar family protein [Stenotrophomonas sp. MH1]